MTENIRARFFLTVPEREKLWNLVDALEQAELDDQDDDSLRVEWMDILLRLLLGKAGIPPLYIKGTVRNPPNESTD